MSFKEIYEQENYENTLSYIVEQIEDKYGTYLSEDEVALIYEVLDVIYEAPKVPNKLMVNSDKFKEAIAILSLATGAAAAGYPLYQLNNINKKVNDIDKIIKKTNKEQ